MKSHAISLSIFVFVVFLGSHAQTNLNQDSVSCAIDHLRNLEYDMAETQLRSWIDAHPADLRAWNYLAIATLYNEMFQRGVLESSVYGEGGETFRAGKVAVTPAFQQELLSLLSKSQQLAEQRIRDNPKDKDAMYWAGVGHGTRATYHFALRKEYIAALHEATAAYEYHSGLLKLDPNYLDSYLVVGMNNYIVGSLPWYIKALASLTGRHGDRAEGLRQIKQVTEKGNFAREDSKLMLAVLYQREKMYTSSLRLYQEMAQSYPRNYLLQYEVSNLFEVTDDWHSAAVGYDSMLAKHRSGESGYQNVPFPKLLYKSGRAYEHLQQDETALQKYIEAGSLSGDDRYIYRSALAAADIYTRQQKLCTARTQYQRIASATPNSEEGKAALHNLRNLKDKIC
jgi:tetratricopeptide (TPR) repeat protein